MDDRLAKGEGTMRVHDEVCGMTIDADQAAASVEFQGKMYYFCSERCRRMFEEHPDRYVPVSDEGNQSAGVGGDRGRQ